MHAGLRISVKDTEGCKWCLSNKSLVSCYGGFGDRNVGRDAGDGELDCDVVKTEAKTVSELLILYYRLRICGNEAFAFLGELMLVIWG